MEINRARESEIRLAKGAYSATRSGVNFARENVNALNGYETDDQNEPDPARFLNKTERKAWNRLSYARKQRYLTQAAGKVNRKNRPAGTVNFQASGMAAGKFSEDYQTEAAGRGRKTGNKPASRKQTGSGASALTGKNNKSMSAGVAGGKGAAVYTAGKTAGKFKQSLQMQEHTLRQQNIQYQSRMEQLKEEGMHSGSSKREYASAAAGSVFTNGLIIVTQVGIAILSGAAMICVPVISVVLLVSVLVSLIAAALSASSNYAGYGLPSFITEEMMEAFFEEQSERGISVSSGVAQLIQESGFGLYGPGGESGQGLSGLAYNYKNLFGIKYYSGNSYASGMVNMTTGEQTSSGGSYTIVDAFCVYEDYRASIRNRSELLLGSLYYPHISPYLNQNDGNYTVSDANNFVAGIKAGGWATDVTYVSSLVRAMETYNLYQFDNMTYEQYQAGLQTDSTYDGTVTPLMQSIVNATSSVPCRSGWCAEWVSNVYRAAGASVIPTGNAIDMWHRYKDTGSTSWDNIPPGAIIVASGQGTSGAIYGHVGIYLGNGKVASPEASVKIYDSLEAFSASNVQHCQGYSGIIGWVFPGGVPKQ